MASGEVVELGIEGITGAREIGRGGFAAVYRATQPDFHREVAVKVVVLPSLDDAARGRFRRECQAIGSLSGHPNIVAVYQSGFTASGLPYLIMDYLANGSLEDALLRDGPRPWRQAAEIGAKMARTLAFAHGHNLLHRDVKPANILTSRFGEPQLADFGIAWAIDTSGHSFSATSSGTPAYAPPETWTDAPPTAAGDIYSLAATMHALITGNPPFRADSAGNVLQVILQVAQQEPADLRPLGVPGPLWDVIKAAMAKEPALRPASADSFADAIEAALAEADGAESSPGVPWPASPSAQLVPPASVPTAAVALPPPAVPPPAVPPPAVPPPPVPPAVPPPAPVAATAVAIAPHAESSPGPAKVDAPAVPEHPIEPPPTTGPIRRLLRALRRPPVAIGVAAVVVAVIAATILLPQGVKQVSVGPGGLRSPTSVAVDGSGAAYVTDNGNGTVIKVDPQGGLSTFAGTHAADRGDGGPATAATLDSPEVLAVDRAGYVYIVAGGVIRKVAPSGIITTVTVHLPGADSPNAIHAQALAIDGAGRLDVATNTNIIQIDPAGATTVVVGTGALGFSGDGQAAVAATVNNPLGVAVGPDGALYVSDSANNRVRRIGTDGVIDTVAGTGGAALGDGGPAKDAGLNYPTGIAFDGAGDLYIVENGGNRLRRVDAGSGDIETVAGAADGSSGFLGDAGPARAALLNQPSSVAVAPSGDVYVVDAGNNRLRRITPGGVISTVA